MQKCIFLDRDGVINEDHVNYTYQIAHFKILDGVIESLQNLKKAGYLLVIITNQSGIIKGIYTKKDVENCYQYLQQACGHIIDGHYYSPYHQDYTNSLSRKPNSLMLEKAISKFGIDVQQSWLIGDSERDIVAGQKLHIPCIKVSNKEQGETKALHWLKDLAQATQFILAPN